MFLEMVAVVLRARYFVAALDRAAETAVVETLARGSPRRDQIRKVLARTPTVGEYEMILEGIAEVLRSRCFVAALARACRLSCMPCLRIHRILACLGQRLRAHPTAMAPDAGTKQLRPSFVWQPSAGRNPLCIRTRSAR